MFYKSVNLFYEPAESCRKIVGEKLGHYSEMTSFQQAFLCGLIRDKQPKKILEIGVSAGGTTSVILNCLDMLCLSTEMYSVDLSERWYRSDELETGFLAKEIMSHSDVFGRSAKKITHSFMLGKSIPHVIDDIGKDIDFLILDTTHSLPGELLDFLVCFPYLKEGCVVVLHDVIVNHLTGWEHEIATKLLFDVVQGDKWYMPEGNDLLGFTNIAAFEIGERTKDSVYNIFSSLTFTWSYMLNQEEKNKYVKVIEKNYSAQYVEWFEKVLELQNYSFVRKQINAHYRMEDEWLKMKWEKNKNVFLYGAGYWAEIYTEYAIYNELPITGWVVSDEQKLIENSYSIPVCRLSDINIPPSECSFILALDKRWFRQVRKNLLDKGYYDIM